MTLALDVLVVFLLCLSSNALLTLTPTSNLTSLATDGDYTCIPRSRLHPTVPSLEDCENAIDQLPDFAGGSSFHNGPPDDPYRLPVTKVVGTCAVAVEMRHQGSTRDSSSWYLIVEFTARAARDCLGHWLWHESDAGAFVHFGKHDRILVSVRYFKDVVGSGRGLEDE